MKILRLMFLFFFISIGMLYSLPSLNGLNGGYRIISASCDKPYSIRFSLQVTDFTRNGIYGRFIRTDNGLPDSLLDDAFMGNISTGFGISFSDYIEFNIMGKYMVDYLALTRAGYRAVSYDLMSKGFGDTQIGLKLSTGSLFGDMPFKMGINPFITIKTGVPYDTILSDTGTLFENNYIGNNGGIFRYFTDNGTDLGTNFLFSIVQEAEGATSNFNVNFGYLGHFYNKPGGTWFVNHHSDFFTYGAGLDVTLKGFSPYFEFTGIHFRSNNVIPNNINYMTIGFNLGEQSQIALNIAFDYRLSSNVDTLMDLIANENYYITQCWGAAPQWKASAGFVYSFKEVDKTPKVGKTNMAILTGRLYDGETGEHLSGKVYFPESELDTITSDTNGIYRIEVPAGPIRIHTIVSGYRWMEKSLIAVANKTNIVDFSLKKKKTNKGYVSGKIEDAKTGTPVKAIISFPDIKDSESIKTDSNGIFRIQLPQGSYTLKVDAAGYAGVIELIVIEQGKAKILNIELLPAKGKVKLTGKVFDKSSQEGINSYVIFKKDGKEFKTVSETYSGIYTIVLSSGIYKVTIKADGYIPKTIPFIVPESGPVIRNFELLKKRAHFILKGIYFNSGSARIKPSSYPILDDIIKTLEEYPDITVEIQGHTDSVGSTENNLQLSYARANSVKGYLIRMGLSSKRLIARGYGEAMPIAPNTTREGRASNRRIEFVVMH